MNKETIEIPLRKATYEELQEVICELQVERYIKDKEIEKAIEFIKENASYDNEEKCCLDDLTYDECDELLNILKGVGKDE